MKPLTMSVLALALLLPIGCSDTTNTEAEARAKAEAAKAELAQKRAELRRTLNDRIDAIDRRMEEYKDRTGKAGRKMKAEGEKTLDTMRDETRDLRAKLARLDDQAASQWDEFKADTERAIDKTENALKEAWDKLKN